MNKISRLLGLALTATVLVSALPAQAQWGRGRDHDRDDRRDDRRYDRRDERRYEDRRYEDRRWDNRRYDDRDYGRYDRYRPGVSISIGGGFGIRVGRGNVNVILRDTYRTRADVDFLGLTYLDNAEDFDIIPVQQCRIQALQIQVQNNDANIDSFRVRYSDGYEQELPVRSYFEQGATSQWVYLPDWQTGNRGRCVSSVVVIGQTAQNGYFDRQQAQVEVFGLKY